MMANTEDEPQHMPQPLPNIYIIGTQSTGKTTLVTALGQYFTGEVSHHNLTNAPHQLKEVARGVLKQHSFTASDITNSKVRALELQRLIIDAQASAEADLGDTWYIADRSALDAVAYAQQYVGAAEARDLQQGTAWYGITTRMKSGVVILCEPNVEWLIDDGVRLMPQDQTEWLDLHTQFVSLLAGSGMQYTVLPSSITQLEERVRFVIDIWNRKRIGEE
ncbi:MAG: hypothetical protein Q9218_003246 [Villophora microphyllina]